MNVSKLPKVELVWGLVAVYVDVLMEVLVLGMLVMM